MQNEQLTQTPFPTHCPVCQTRLIWKGKDLICPGYECLPQITKSIAYFYSDKGMDVLTIGEQRIFELLQKPELFELLSSKPFALLDPIAFKIYDQVQAIWGRQRMQNYMNSLAEINNRKTPIHFIASLGLPNLAYKTAMKLFYFVVHGRQCKSISSKAMKSFGLGFATYQSALESFDTFKFAPVPAPPEVIYCITGTLTQSRSDMIDYLVRFKWQFTNQVTKATNYLITGSNPGRTKTQKASDYSIQTINEDKLMEILQS